MKKLGHQHGALSLKTIEARPVFAGDAAAHAAGALGIARIFEVCPPRARDGRGFVSGITPDLSRVWGRSIDELNQSVIKEVRANQGKVGGPMRRDARLVADDDWRHDGSNPGAPIVLLARWRSRRDNRFLRRRAAKSALVL